LPENPWELTYPDQSEISMWCGYTRATLKSEHDISSVPSRTLADAVPWSHAGQFLSMVARWLALVHGRELANSCSPSPRYPCLFLDRALANAVPQAPAGQCCSLVACEPIPIPERELANAVPWSQLWLIARVPFPGHALANSSR